MTDNVVKFPEKKRKPVRVEVLVQSNEDYLKELHLKRIDEIEDKQTIERLICAKYAMISIVNSDGTVSLLSIGNPRLKEGISLYAASIEAMTEDIV